MAKEPSPSDPAASIPLAPDRPRPDRTPHVEGIGPFVPYVPKSLKLACTFEVPDNWLATEQQGRGERYQQIILVGPRNAQDTYHAGLTVRITPVGAGGGSYATLEDLIDWRRKQYAQTAGFSELSFREVSVVGPPAKELKWIFQVTLPSAVGPQTVLLKNQLVLFAHQEQLYELSFGADAVEFERYAPAFEHLLQSFQLVPSPQ